LTSLTEVAIIEYEEEIHFFLQLKVVAPAAFAYRERRGIFLYPGTLDLIDKTVTIIHQSVCISWHLLHSTASLEQSTSQARGFLVFAENYRLALRICKTELQGFMRTK